MKPNLFQYEDYRKYLADMYAFFKETRRGFSYRSFAKEAGLNSFNYLKLVIDGERNLSPSMVVAFAKGLKLNQSEWEFFEKLVHFNQAKNHEEKKRYFESLLTSNRYREIHELEATKYEYFSHWYYAAVRELVLVPGFKSDPKWISKHLRPAITEAQAKDALELLLNLGLLIPDRGGKLRQAELNVASPPEIASLSAMNFHRQMISMATYSLENEDYDLRDISSITVTIPPEEIEKIKKKIFRFRRGLLAQFGRGGIKRSRVYQMNVQLFPLSEMATEE